MESFKVAFSLLLSSRVTFNTTVSNIINAFLGVLALRFALLVAIIASPVRGFARVAYRTLPVGAFMVHREGVPADVNIAPIAGVVAR